MLAGPKDTVALASAPASEKPVYPTIDPEIEKPEPVAASGKTSKVNRPIPIADKKAELKVPEDKTEEKRPPEKKVEEKKTAPEPAPKTPPQEESQKAEASKPLAPPPIPPPSPKKEEPKKAESKPAEEKKVPAPPPVEKKEEPKPVEKTEKGDAKPVEDSYGLPSVFPLDTSTPAPRKEEPKKEGTAAFQPLVPPELEKEYKESTGKAINQAELPRPLPQLKQQPVSPERSAPLYAAPFTPEPRPESRKAAPEPAAPLKKLPEVESPPSIPGPSKSETESKPNPVKRKPPKAVWDTVDSIMERPIVYE